MLLLTTAAHAEDQMISQTCMIDTVTGKTHCIAASPYPTASSATSTSGVVISTSPTLEMQANNVMTLPAGQSIITIYPSGKVDFPSDVSLDEASRQFWDAVRQMGLRLACEK
jgi:hypothetical protein